MCIFNIETYEHIWNNHSQNWEEKWLDSTIIEASNTLFSVKMENQEGKELLNDTEDHTDHSTYQQRNACPQVSPQHSRYVIKWPLRNLSWLKFIRKFMFSDLWKIKNQWQSENLKIHRCVEVQPYL